ncbi:MAG: transcriptional regulator [Pseudomonadota bacterium]|nr:transcriptional regulator [Pseudomonadota bacterium]
MLTLPFTPTPRPEPLYPRRLKPARGLASALPRPGLLERIEAGLDGQLVLVQAPPGFGKTELLLSAFQRLAKPADQFVWMTLDADDSDPRRFLADLARALGSGALGVLGAEPPDAEALLRVALNAMAAESGRVVVFLDDFHTATGAGFLDCIAQLLRRSPDNVTFVVASRRRVDLPLARLRVRDLVSEVHAEDLAFTRDECRGLLGATASIEEAGRLRAATGGWPALVHLGLTSPRKARAAKGGAEPLYREFLVEEFLPELPAPLRDALSACAILDEFPLALAADLAGVEFDPDLPFDIADFWPAIEPASDRPGWVRLGPILLSTLRERALAKPPAATAALHVRAARWFAERDILDKAVHHASHGGDFQFAAELIGRAGGVNIYLRLGYTVLERLLADLPPAIVDRSPALRLCHAVALSKQGQVQAARSVIEELKRAQDRHSRGAVFDDDLAHIDALVDCYEDRRLDAARIAELEDSVNDHRSQDRWRRGWNYNHLCIAYQRAGDLRLARRAGLRALAAYRERKSPYAQAFMLAHLGTVLIRGGRMAAALKALRSADHLVQQTHSCDANLAAIVRIPLAMAIYHQGDVGEAERMLSEAMPIVARGEGWVDPFENGYGTLARARSHLHGFDAGLAVLDSAEELAVERDLPRLALSIAVARVELLARGGLLESARAQLDRLPELSSEPERFAINLADWPTWRERQDALLARARLLILSSQAEAALAPLTFLIADALGREAGLDMLLGEIHLTEALWALDRFEEALNALQRSIALARPQDLVQPFLDAGPNYSKVVRAITRRFGLSLFSADTAAFIVRINGLGDRRATAAKPEGKLLSARELEVLSWIEADLSNKEIARKLQLSEITVKFHMKNLFRKLGVGRRSLAISVARAAGLL